MSSERKWSAVVARMLRARSGCWVQPENKRWLGRGGKPESERERERASECDKFVAPAGGPRSFVDNELDPFPSLLPPYNTTSSCSSHSYRDRTVTHLINKPPERGRRPYAQWPSLVSPCAAAARRIAPATAVSYI